MNNLKVFALNGSYIYTKIIDEMNLESEQERFIPHYSVHKDNIITSYGTLGTELGYFYDVGFYRIKTGSAELAEGDIVFMVHIVEYGETETHKLYYPCEYGLAEWSGSYSQFNNTYEQVKSFALWRIMDDTSLLDPDPQGSVVGNALNFIINTPFDHSWTIQLHFTEQWAYLEHGDFWPTGAVDTVVINYSIPSSGTNIELDASGTCNVHCINTLNSLRNAGLKFITSTTSKISEIDGDLAITVTELQNVTETVDELEPMVDSLDDRVSALESETISKYVSR